jgi:hypothetical protein
MTSNAAIDRPSTAALRAAVEGPCRIACWAPAPWWAEKLQWFYRSEEAYDSL